MSRTGVELRDGRFADVQSVYKALTGIEKDFLTPGRTVYKDLPVLSRTVAYDGDRPVGFADWYPSSRKKGRAHLCVAVSNGARGKGLAGKMAIDSLKKLVRQLAEEKARARREGGAELDKWRSQARIQRFVWGLDAKNTASARAAERAGFREQEFKRPRKFRRFVMSRGEAERVLPKYIGFPEEEHKTLIGRDFIVTHRVSNDARRFRKGDKVRTPWGAEYVVADRSDLKKADNSPYYGELTDAQRRLLRAYRRISLLRLEKKAEADIPAIYDGVRKQAAAAKVELVDPNFAAIMSRDVYYNGAEPRVLRDSDGMLQVVGPKGNVASDVMIISEREAFDRLDKLRAKNRRLQAIRALFTAIK